MSITDNHLFNDENFRIVYLSVFLKKSNRSNLLRFVLLLGSLGNFLGSAIENTKLMETIRQHRQELRGLTEKLFKGQEVLTNALKHSGAENFRLSIIKSYPRPFCYSARTG